MGSIELIAKADHSYHAILDSTPNISIANKYSLPQPQLKGYTLRIQQRDENIIIFAYDQTGSADSLSVQISNRGVLQYLIKALPHNKQLETTLPKESLPEGINLFTLLDHHRQPVAERLYFNKRQETRLSIQVSTDKSNYENREKTDVEIQLFASNGQPAIANVSLMAIHRDHLGDRRALRENILTHLLLQSELRGEIDQPNYYFQQDSIVQKSWMPCC